jgi:hypothetical protein
MLAGNTVVEEIRNLIEKLKPTRRLPMIYLTSPVAKAVYESFLAFCAFYALNDGRTVVAIVFGTVSALVFWNASQQWKNATK